MELFDALTRRWFASALGEPTAVQKEAWPAIASGGHTLVTAPTGTGKTLSAFLVFLDRLMAEARSGTLTQELRVIYVSPLKALAGDIRENLRRPLYGIAGEAAKAGFPPPARSVTAAVRTGDTSSYERQKMIKTPPHILITTPESLFLLLTSASGKTMLKTARAVIIDELHAVIDSKRGAHLTLSLARLDTLCGRALQRVGLSATIEPPEEAARYLSGGAPVTVVAPKMKKAVTISVTAPAEDMHNLPHGTVWPELASAVYDRCADSRSVIAFVDGRQFAEKLAYYVNRQAEAPNLTEDGAFARTHHGCVSKEQRLRAENDLRSGKLRLLCATSSMELGIDVGEIDRVMQIGCPSSISSVMQRLGRAGHNPGRVSVMDIFPRTDAEGLYCGLTARVATDGGVERLHPPRLCLDVLAQHLVSMACGEDGYTIEDVMELLPRAFPFRDVTREDVESVLRMLAGDYEHRRDLPVRPRILYDRVNGRVDGDTYSRMLAVSAGGTIPDLGMYAVKTEGGAKLGELDEEFVGEARVGDRFLLGSFAWKIVKMDKETVIVAPTAPAGAQPPFWKLAWLSRRRQTGLAFGALLRKLNEASGTDQMEALLRDWLLDDAAVKNTVGVLKSQKNIGFPDDRTVIAEHFQDEAGEQQIMVHSVFGKQVNAPLSLLLQETVRRSLRIETYCYAGDDGILLMASFGGVLPDGLLSRLSPETARGTLEALLPSSPLFNMLFRHNAGRALMMGVRKGKRQPLWVQRLRGAEMLDSVIGTDDHPLIRETKRECLEDYWDLDGLEWLLNGIRSGQIAVREVHADFPSPLSLPLRRQAENTLLYDYFPTTGKIQNTEALEEMQKIKPAAEQLARAGERKRLPEDEKQLHALLMTEGDLLAGELEVPGEWFEALARRGRALYIEPGFWIAAEHAPDYADALEERAAEALTQVVRRSLRYRGAQSPAQISERYFLPEETVLEVLSRLAAAGSAVEEGGVYYHADVYERARHETVAARRRQVRTAPPERYAALLAERVAVSASPAEQLKRAVSALGGVPLSPAAWEGSVFPARVANYNPALLDALLAGGEWFWTLSDGALTFHPSAELDWDADLSAVSESLEGNEKIIYNALLRRGASFSAPLASLLPDRQPVAGVTLSLAEKGLIRADSFVPVRQLLERERTEKAPPKRRLAAQVKLMTEGRWETVRPLTEPSPEARLSRVFERYTVACRETWKLSGSQVPWASALEILRIREYTGQVRRGYFVEGLSGAQFVLSGQFDGFVYALENPARDILWLSAADPAQLWGKALRHLPGRDFTNLHGSVVALREGVPAAVFERQGNVLRVFEPETLPEALRVFAEAFAKKRVYPHLRRLTVKQYPKDAAPALKSAGFVPVMLDYELVR